MLESGVACNLAALRWCTMGLGWIGEKDSSSGDGCAAIGFPNLSLHVHDTRRINWSEQDAVHPILFPANRKRANSPQDNICCEKKTSLRTVANSSRGAKAGDVTGCKKKLCCNVRNVSQAIGIVKHTYGVARQRVRRATLEYRHIILLELVGASDSFVILLR